MTQHITSRQNARVKEAAKLRDARQRQRQGRFLVDGGRELLRAIGAGVEFLEAYVCPSLLQSDDARRAAAELQTGRSLTATVTEEVFEKLSYGERSDGVVAIARTPQRSLHIIALREQPLVAVIEGVEKPGNVGAVLRSADGAGVDALIIADPRTDLFNPNTIRASLGTVFQPNVCTASSEETRAWLRRLGLAAYAARPEADLLYTEVDYRGGAAIILGSEACGLTEQWSAAGVVGVRLPMCGIADSLNVSVTAAVLFYEAQRQRGWAPSAALNAPTAAPR